MEFDVLLYLYEHRLCQMGRYALDYISSGQFYIYSNISLLQKSKKVKSKFTPVEGLMCFKKL